jgi:type IV pilus assembly protein PilA
MKVKDKKGFTLTELLAIIVIICILLVIAVPIYRKIKEQSLNQSYKNVVSTIEVAAEKYASDTGIEITNVDQLVKTGYLPADDETGNVYDPRDNSILNCYEIDIINNGNDEYNAELKSERKTNDNNCDISYIQENSGLLCNDSSCKTTWYEKGKIILSVDYNYISTKYSISKENILSYNWTSTTGANASTETFTIEDNNNVINSKYNVTIITKDGNKIYIKQLIRIDNEAPNVFENEAGIDNNKWDSSKTIKVIGSDGVGSGIKGYYIFKNNNAIQCPTDLNLYTNNNTYTVTENGQYSLCMIDNVNNISTIKTITVEKVDSVKPDIPIISASDYVLTENTHASSFTLTIYSTDTNLAHNISPVHYEYAIDNANNFTNSNHLDIDSSYNGKTIYAKACSEAGLCSDNNSYKVVYSETGNYYYPVVPGITPSPSVSGSIINSAKDDCDATCQMEINSDAWLKINSNNGNCYPNCSLEVLNQLKDLQNSNSDWSKVNSDCGSGCTFHSDGYWYDANGNKLYSTNNQTNNNNGGSNTGSGGGGSGTGTGSNIGTDSWRNCMSNCGESTNQTACGDACDG